MKVNGKKIKELRLAADMSMVSLADAADFKTEGSIRQIEARESYKLNRHIAGAIAKHLGVKREAIEEG